MKTAIGTIVLALASAAWAGSTVEVTPGNMHGWSFESSDPNGNIVTSGPYLGTGALVTGPATPPLGIGSAHLATQAGNGDGAEILDTDHFDGTALSAISTLSYATFDVTNNGQQFPYLALSISTNGQPIASDLSNLDILFFEPPYQTPTSGSPSLPNQGATVMNQWQIWDAAEGGWWDNNSIDTEGTGVGPLSDFVTAYPLATIEPASFGTGSIGGVSFNVGFASSGDSFDGYVDDFTIGTATATTTYDFEPGVSSSTPLPATVWEAAGLFVIVGAGWAKKRFAAKA